MENEILELEAERQHLLLTNRDILDRVEKREDKVLTDDESRLIESNTREADEIENKIKGLQRTIETRRKVEAQTNKMREDANTRTVLAQAGARVQNGNESGGLTPSYAYPSTPVRNFRSVDDAYTSGMWFLAKFCDYAPAQRFCKEKGIFNAIREAAAMRAMSEGSNTSGGALVPEPLEAAIIAIRTMYGVFRKNARIWTMSSATSPAPRRTGGVTVAITGEGTAPDSQTGPTFDQVNLAAKKVSGYVAVSSELSEDAVISVAEYVAEEFGLAFAKFEDEWGFTGDGTVTYGGRKGLIPQVTGLGNTYKAYCLATSGVDSFAEITAAELSRLMGRIHQSAIPNAKFYCSSTALATIFERLAISAGGNTMSMINGMWTPSYLGKPIEVTETMFADDGATAGNGQPMLLYGDIRMAATMGERRGLMMKQSDQVKFLEDQIVIKGDERIDINVHDYGQASTSTKPPYAVFYGKT